MEIAGQLMHPSHRIYGIAFGRTKDSGKRISVAKGVVEGETLLIKDWKSWTRSLWNDLEDPRAKSKLRLI